MKDWNRNTKPKAVKGSITLYHRLWPCHDPLSDGKGIRTTGCLGLNVVPGCQDSIITHYDFRTSHGTNSPRDKRGRLLLTENEYSMIQGKGRCFEGSADYSIVRSSKCLDIKRVGTIGFSIGGTDESNFSRKFLPGDTFMVDSSSKAENMARYALFGELSQIKLNIGVSLAEGQKTIDLVASTASTIYDAYKNLRKGNLKKFNHVLFSNGKHTRRFSPKKETMDKYRSLMKNKKRSPKQDEEFEKILANLWLSYSYGWVPLYNDVYGALIATFKEYPGFPVKVTRKESGNIPGSAYSTETLEVSGGVFYTDKVTKKVNVKRDPSHNIQNALELGLQNPALIVWELIPFSFVWDWWNPVGSWLESQTATLGLSFSHESTTRTRTTTANLFTSDVHTLGVKHKAPARILLSFKGKHRSLSALQQPRMYIKNPLNWAHAATAISLLIGIGSNTKLRT